MPLLTSSEKGWYYFSIYPFKLANNTFLRWRARATILLFTKGKGLTFSLACSVSVLSASLPLPASFMCPCVTVQPQCASPFLWEASLGSQCVGEDLRLAPHLSVAYLNHAHSCHPSYCLPISLSAVTQSPASLCFSHKGAFLSLSPG